MALSWVSLRFQDYVTWKLSVLLDTVKGIQRSPFKDTLLRQDDFIICSYISNNI